MAATCRRWRAVALLTPALWTDVSYTISKRAAFPQNRWASCFETHVERSRALLLDVDIHWRATRGLVPDLHMAVLALTRRARTFSFKTHANMGPYEFFGAAPHLLDCTITHAVEDVGSLPWRLFLQAPRLTSFAFRGYRLDWAGNQPTFPHIRRLALDEYAFAANDFSFTLERLVPHVQELSLIVRGVCASSLSVRAPHLRTLRLSMPSGTLGFIPACDFPALRTVSISLVEYSSEANITALMHSCLGTVDALSLSLGQNLLSTSVLDGLTVCGNVKSLNLVMGSYPDDRIPIIEGLRLPALCPRLETLTLIFRGSSAGLFSLVWQPFARAVDALAEARRPVLKSVELFDPDDELVPGALQALQQRLNTTLGSA
ncbi:hypothetical protein EXIGLDRAFT_723898 [Exidia glandulosa HHB12029]|uniref:F-box domain-containing protein n=1 Tax=Exidia glandulosa HHB12029 TaxID=1314781 RepID=A0A165MVZ3_EXIGL|nr:hypothetical protein EXIGLDRAFT_723898 [Exidia glandulosa HHB12029]